MTVRNVPTTGLTRLHQMAIESGRLRSDQADALGARLEEESGIKFMPPKPKTERDLRAATAAAESDSDYTLHTRCAEEGDITITDIHVDHNRKEIHLS